MHKNALTTKDERKKPHVITFYDRTKGGVDVIDMMASTYTVKFKSRCWTMNALAYILDTVRTNMTTLWNELNPESKMSSFDFLWQLGEELIKPHILARSQSTGMQKHVTDAMKEVLGGDFEPAPMQSLEVSQVDRSKCYVCMKEIAGTNEYKRKKNNLTKCKWSCIKCGKKLCKAHFFCVCESCK